MCYGHIAGQHVVIMFDTGNTKDVISEHLVALTKLQTTKVFIKQDFGFAKGMHMSFSKEYQGVS